MKTPILTSPPTTSAPTPALTTPAPAKPPMSAWEELLGSPQYHVMRFQTMAPRSPARITHWSTTLVSTTPLPTVVATTSGRSEEHTSELQSRGHLVCRLLLENKKIDMTAPARSP